MRHAELVPWDPKAHKRYRRVQYQHQRRVEQREFTPSSKCGHWCHPNQSMRHIMPQNNARNYTIQGGGGNVREMHKCSPVKNNAVFVVVFPMY